MNPVRGLSGVLMTLMHLGLLGVGVFSLFSDGGCMPPWCLENSGQSAWKLKVTCYSVIMSDLESMRAARQTPEELDPWILMQPLPHSWTRTS